MLFHEATLDKSLKKQAKQTLHSTTVDAANIANKSNVKKLVIGHFSARYTNVKPLVEESKEIFPNTFSAEDGERHSVELERM